MSIINTDPLKVSDLIDLAVEGKDVPVPRALATFADPSNWAQVYDGKNSDGVVNPACQWAFIGPVKPPYELAQQAMNGLKKKIEEQSDN